MSQSATSSSKWGGRRKLPLAFTEHGAVMAANVLNSPVAVAASIQVVRAFVRQRQILATHKDLARKLDELEKNYDAQFRIVFEAIRQLILPPPGPAFMWFWRFLCVDWFTIHISYLRYVRSAFYLKQESLNSQSIQVLQTTASRNVSEFF